MSLGEFIPSSNTKLLLHLNGNSTDSSGNGNNGTDTSITYSQANGKFGQGAGFNGDGRVTITNTILPSTATNYTISAWINTANDTTEKTIISDRYGGSYAYKYRFCVEKTTKILRHMIFNSALTQLTSSGVIPATTWTHVAVTVTVGGTCYLYINGKQDGSASYTVGSYPQRANQSTIGVITGPVTEGYFNGSIDEVIVENVAWSAEKVKKYYTMTKGRFATL
jgi:hypothetical protein